MIKYKKTKGLDLKSHKLQQLLDKVFISPPLSRYNIEQFSRKIVGNTLGLSAPKNMVSRAARAFESRGSEM